MLSPATAQQFATPWTAGESDQRACEANVPSFEGDFPRGQRRQPDGKPDWTSGFSCYGAPSRNAETFLIFATQGSQVGSRLDEDNV